MPLNEELLARVDERTLNLQTCIAEVKKTVESGQKDMKDAVKSLDGKLDNIQRDLAKTANLCPLGEDRTEAHKEVETRLDTIEKKQSTNEGVEKANRNWTAKIITLTAIVVAVVTFIIDKAIAP